MNTHVFNQKFANVVFNLLRWKEHKERPRIGISSIIMPNSLTCNTGRDASSPRHSLN